MAGRYSQDQPVEFHFGQWSTESESYDDVGPAEPLSPDDVVLYDCELPPKFTVKPLFEAMEEQDNSHISNNSSHSCDIFDFGSTGTVLGLDDTMDFRESVIRNSLNVAEMALLQQGLSGLEEEEEASGSGDLVISKCEEVLDSGSEESQTELVVTECEELADSDNGDKQTKPDKSILATTDRMLLLTDSDSDPMPRDSWETSKSTTFNVPRLKFDESTTIHSEKPSEQPTRLSHVSRINDSSTRQGEDLSSESVIRAAGDEMPERSGISAVLDDNVSIGSSTLKSGNALLQSNSKSWTSGSVVAQKECVTSGSRESSTKKTDSIHDKASLEFEDQVLSQSNSSSKASEKSMKSSTKKSISNRSSTSESSIPAHERVASMDEYRSSHSISHKSMKSSTKKTDSIHDRASHESENQFFLRSDSSSENFEKSMKSSTKKTDSIH